jgi:hypothetical protein
MAISSISCFGDARDSGSGQSRARIKVNLSDAVGKIENTKVKNAFTAMLTLTGDDVDNFRKRIENWFNSTMDRVSGWYKPRSQVILFTLGSSRRG